ncbi:glutamate receptor ionotropic, kainate glr-3-like [Dermatophagoides pteronyssinus]|uniref:glutamate receptor ionotropic, kainate glr-3-like n=1 Tax=Dermatophagoides pteronyssinus TaxID=6956 RepID=UPI003F675EFF
MMITRKSSSSSSKTMNSKQFGSVLSSISSSNKSIMNKLIIIILKIIIIIPLISSPFALIINAETLHGTTILNWPFVSQRSNGQFEGYCIDLLNELAPLMGITYTLSLVRDGQYGGWLSPTNGTVNGMIGEVSRGEADFAIGDITVLTNRARFVDFTQPFMEYGLAALIRRDILERYGHHIRTFKELSEQTDIRYGVKKHGANLPLFHDSPTVAKMYSYMDTHPSVFVDGESEGLKRVKQERYAFITESPFVEYIVERDCDLVAIDDRRRNFQFEYAIALPKNSPLKDRFNRALRQLRMDGKLSELKQRYWQNHNRNCPNDSNFDPNRPKSTTKIQFSDHTNRRKPNTDDDDNSSGRLRHSGGRIQPHDRIDEDDVELIKPRSDRTRRPIKPTNFRNSDSTFISGNFPKILFTIMIILIIFVI